MKNCNLERMYSLLARKIVSRLSIVTTAIITVMLMRIDADLAGFGGKGAFYLQAAFTKSNFMDILSSWRSGGIVLLERMIWLNYINAASYAVLFASAIAFFSEARRRITGDQVSRSDMVLILLPVSAALVDVISNTLLGMLFSGITLRDDMILAVSILSTIKWVLVFLSLLMILKSYFSFRKAMKQDVPKAP